MLWAVFRVVKLTQINSEKNLFEPWALFYNVAQIHKTNSYLRHTMPMHFLTQISLTNTLFVGIKWCQINQTIKSTNPRNYDEKFKCQHSYNRKSNTSQNQHKRPKRKNASPNEITAILTVLFRDSEQRIRKYSILFTAGHLIVMHKETRSSTNW